ncbi:hypothetical protein G7L40_21065 [Paenibacillus polymyxa]|uniref:Uncharacterized protein n=1 Tax=Paenibacillus polymyxa TaxID=1406 RepID=A0A378Y0Q6_PAEPO|nr:hypothetical protein [Paenibacillus polymyxa]MBE7901212.1 hypothetical protein [Paenibacillus polymyxa]MBG9764492.1 hypothetical protein [Paenibacillus polymyxa]MBG9765088.1 hypothetical protein [Paenibacillus polymyxa]MBG9766021.1 hypothetical protein [Paenibacillus polymyxa]MBG9766186.1 hypothetical protein [Paenibacillus polymyxa]
MIHLKRRIERFYTDEDGELVFALYEDIDGYVHYRYCTFDTDKHSMLSVLFEKEFKEEQS